ncbi:MAG TPA: amino acid adenylation domain-containing protein, partial [Blastocatellia bacterium]|nr:amino acid adenylation domain-containing protein [Blastocatellia bacterium]
MIDISEVLATLSDEKVALLARRNPLSFAQERLWFLDQLAPGRAIYNIPAFVRMGGALSVEALEKSLNGVIKRHAALRTCFPTLRGEAVQIVKPSMTIRVPVIDLRDLPPSLREDEARRLASEEARKPFNLSRGPLIRATVITLDERDHIALFTMHHIISDGWSIAILVEELSELYAAYTTRRRPDLPELPIQYADYAHWQREHLQGEFLGQQVSYWKRRLAGAPPVLNLPSDRPRPSVQTYRGATESLIIPKPLTLAIKSLASSTRVTLFMTLVAAFQTLLHRYTNQDDIVIGTPIAGRNRVETERLIGFFLNMLVLRTDLSGDPTVRELLARVKTITLEAFQYQDLPFEKLVEEIQPDRTLSHTPLFQVMFVLQNTPGGAVELPGLELRPWGGTDDEAKFDLSLAVNDTGDQLRASLSYNTDLFDRPTVRRMLAHFQTLLEGMTQDPDRVVSSLPLLSEPERAKLLVEWNDTAKEFDRQHCLHLLIEEQIERTPDAIAVASEQGQLSYRELGAKANKLANHLQKLGVGPESLVAVCTERGLEMAIALLGVLKAGGAYVPLDPSYPKDRLDFMLRDSNARVVLTQEGLAPELPETGSPIVCLDRDWPQIEAESDSKPGCRAIPENLAYMIYTSGSTGRPKGAMNTHRSISNRLLWMAEQYEVTPDDSILQKTPFSFDVSVWELFLPLIRGARLVMAKPGGHQDGGYLLDVIRRERITMMHFVPSMLEVFLSEPGLSEIESLRQVISSGEALTREQVKRFHRELKCELDNLYGPTECAVDVTARRCGRGEEGIISIGKPIANTKIYILDRSKRLVPEGVSGELHIAGEQVGRGYLGAVEKTAENFVPDPFGAPGSRMYATGDEARYTAGGEIEYLGRLDHQVKIRGFRIELG